MTLMELIHLLECELIQFNKAHNLTQSQSASSCVSTFNLESINFIERLLSGLAKQSGAQMRAPICIVSRVSADKFYLKISRARARVHGIGLQTATACRVVRLAACGH